MVTYNMGIRMSKISIVNEMFSSSDGMLSFMFFQRRMSEKDF